MWEMQNQGLKVESILKLIPNEVLDQLAQETQVDRNVKKLSGKSLFQLFLFSLMNSDRMSLRVMEHHYQAEQFKTLTGRNNGATKHSSLSDRLRTVNPEYFEKIFDYLGKTLVSLSPDQATIKVTRFDSTLITLSSKLLPAGRPTPTGSKNQIKFTLAFDGLPKDIKIFHDKSSAGSEEIALKKAIADYSDKREGIVVFDRGLSSRKTYRDFDEDSIKFVTRLNDNTIYKEVGDIGLFTDQDGDLIIRKDVEVKLGIKGSKWLDHKFRLIIATPKAEEKPLLFLTNIRDLDANDIAAIYKKRWDIEVFFRFIKQELNAKHFISRDLNGITVTIYMILILATLLLIYKLSNHLSGYKHVKIKFRQELEMEIIKDMILFCGGDPSRLAQREGGTPLWK
jgi:hypothetical protein